MNFGERMRARREELGLSRTLLARRLGVHAGADVRLAFTKIGNGFWAVRLK